MGSDARTHPIERTASMTRPTARRSNYRITRRLSAIHRTHATAPHLGCVLCIVGVTPAR
jgi:hypothetical protein